MVEELGNLRRLGRVLGIGSASGRPEQQLRSLGLACNQPLDQRRIDSAPDEQGAVNIDRDCRPGRELAFCVNGHSISGFYPMLPRGTPGLISGLGFLAKKFPSSIVEGIRLRWVGLLCEPSHEGLEAS